MIEELQQFGSLSLARRTGGVPVELQRSKDEVVFLAFDNRIRRLVELHVLRGGATLDATAKRSALERAKQASELRSHSFMRILEVGEDQGMVYYTSNLSDGEFVEDYVSRRGAVPPAVALGLVSQLLEDLLQLGSHQRLVSRMHLDRVLVTTLEDTFLQLRVYDYGLSLVDAGTEAQSGARLVVEGSRLIFLLLTGQPHYGENPDRFPALTQLPTSLRTTIRAALGDPVNSPSSIEKLRDDVREAFSALTSNAKARGYRRHLVANQSLLPQSQLQEILLEKVPVETILGSRFAVEDAEHARRYPFSIPAVNKKAEQTVMVHLLPPARVVEKARYEAVPLQVWRFNPARHPNILRSLSLWESPEWTFLTEEREPGFALSRLMAERITLNPAEVVVLMRQVHAGLEQAVECGVPRVDMHPSNILLRVGKGGPLQSRETERLMQKRLDAWPPFLVKLRPHMTMRSLYEPLLVDIDIPDGSSLEEHLRDRDFRNRSFVALTAYLLTGERQSGESPTFPESVPEAASAYVRECLALTQRAGKAPATGEFIEKFESLLTAQPIDFATRLRGGAVALEEMESAGSVSDFEDDWGETEADSSFNADGTIPGHRSLKAHEFHPLQRRKKTAPWGILAAAAAVALSFAGWMFLGRGSENHAVTKSPAPSAEAEGPGKIAAKAKPDSESKQIVATHPTPVREPQSPSKVTKVPPLQASSQQKKPLPPSSKPAPAMSVAVPNPARQAATPPSTKPPATNPTRAGDQPAASQSSNAVAHQTDKPAPTLQPKPAATAQPPPEKTPITIRRAIVPTKEEIDKMKQGHVENQTGQLPVMSTASPLPLPSKGKP